MAKAKNYEVYETGVVGELVHYDGLKDVFTILELVSVSLVDSAGLHEVFIIKPKDRKNFIKSPVRYEYHRNASTALYRFFEFCDNNLPVMRGFADTRVISFCQGETQQAKAKQKAESNG